MGWSEVISEKEIKKRVIELASKISGDYAGEDVTFIGVLNGSFVFLSDLIREVSIPMYNVEFIKVNSYSGTKSEGCIREKLFLAEEYVRDKNVVVVEDIIDTGLTLKYILKRLSNMHPKSLEVCTLIVKQNPPLIPKYVGFEIDDVFVAGYGMDYDGIGRGIKNIIKYDDEDT